MTGAADAILPWQIACEFIAASRKLAGQGFTPPAAWARLSEFLGVFRLALPTPGVLDRAHDLHVTRAVSFRDALVLAACMESGVDVLYSEDVPGLESFGTLRVINPFLKK